MLDLRQLATLRAIDRTGSIAGAARDMYVSQPTVTHHLDALERSVGTRLVARGPRGTHLTDIGRVLLVHADAVLDRLASAEDEVRALAAQGVATLRVGTFPSAGATLLPRALSAVQSATGVRVELTEGETPGLLRAIDEGALHAALLYADLDSALDLPEGWRCTWLLDDPFLLALPAGHPLGDRGAVSLRDLADEGWILARDPGDPADLALMSAAAHQGFVPRAVLRTDDFAVSFGFVAAGLGIALIPRLAREPHPGVIVRPLEGVTPARSVHFARPVQAPPPVIRLEAELLAEAETAGSQRQIPPSRGRRPAVR